MRDPNLRKSIISTLRSLLANAIAEPEENHTIQLFTCLSDLKFMAKSEVLPVIIKETNFLEELIRCLVLFHFSDCQIRPKEMQPFDNSTIKQIRLV